MNICYIGMGGNIDNPKQHVLSAIEEIACHESIELLSKSGLYLTDPVGYRYQPKYINAVICIATTMQPLELLDSLQDIENKHGRIRINGKQNMPRSLDLDILLYGEQSINCSRLIIPHPRMLTRNFVLVPLYEIAPDNRIFEMSKPDVTSCQLLI